MKRWGIALVFAITFSYSSFAQDKPMHEVYSMMVYNFVKYIQWPNGSSGEFVIAVVGNTEMYNTMFKLYDGTKIGVHTCSVKQVKSGADLGDCRVVFVDRSRSGDFDTISDKIKGKSTLLITDKNGLGLSVVAGSILKWLTVN